MFQVSTGQSPRSRALMGARLVVVAKTDGGVRGIATGCIFRRLVARTLAKQFVKVFEAECSPFQYALSTRAGTDCVGHMLRAATDSDPSMTILRVDGIGAHDHIFRSAMLGRLLKMPGARELRFNGISWPPPSPPPRRYLAYEVCSPPPPPAGSLGLRDHTPPPPQYRPCLGEGVAGLRPAMPSHKHGLCPPAGNVQQKGPLRVQRWGFRV